jgi:hypothetical protein
MANQRPRDFWRAQDQSGEREMPRQKREKVVRYYSKVLSGVLSALDDGRQTQDSEEKPAKLPSRTYVEWILVALGFDAQDWVRIGDDEIVRLNACQIRQTDEAGHQSALNRFKKQRQRTNEWQGEAGNPILVEHRVIYDHEEKRNYSEYRVPLGELLQSIIADAPVGTSDYHLKQKLKKHVREYLLRFDGTAKPVHKVRHPSPVSDAHRSATLARKAFDLEASRGGRDAAISLLQSSLRAELGSDFEEIFRPTFYFDNYQESQEDSANLSGDICHLCGARKPVINPTTCVEKESDQNFDEIQGVL